MTDKENCILCGSSDFKLLFEGRDKLVPSEDKFSVVKCNGCGLVRTLPAVSRDDMRKYYPEKYYNITKDTLTLHISKFEDSLSRYYSKLLWKMLLEEKRNFIRRTGDFLTNLLFIPFYRYRNRCFPYKDKPGKFLDIGCGSGKLLFEQKRLGWEVYGVELGKKMSSYAREVRKLNVITGEFSDAEYERDFFDIANLHHVLEHFLEPLDELRKAHKILKPGGLLVIRVPNRNKIETAIFGKHWYAYDLPRHRFHFDRETIRQLLLKAGFKPLKTVQVLHINSMILSIRSVLEDRKAPHGLISFFSIENKLARGIFLPLCFLFKAAGQSSEMLVYAKKEQAG
jgi:SAM-dependent methyltransferase